MNTFTEYDFLCHHGILGMKWGIRRYQNYDGTLIKSGSATRRKTKYTNIDGSLNERGKIHSQAYINKELAKNEKYYNKHIKKYEKLAEKYKDDPEMKKKFEAMKEDAIRTKNSVDESIKAMGIDEIMSNEHEAKIKALKVAGAIAAGAAIASGAGLSVAGISNAIKNSSDGVKAAIKNFNPQAPMDTVIDIVNTTPIGREAEKVAQTAIRTYSDARAYVAAIYLDQTCKRLKNSGVTTEIGSVLSDTMNQAVHGVDQNAVYKLSDTVNMSLQNALQPATRSLNTVNDISGNLVKLSYSSGANNIKGLANSISTLPNSTINQLSNLDSQTAILLNDPNYLNLITKVCKQ